MTGANKSKGLPLLTAALGMLVGVGGSVLLLNRAPDPVPAPPPPAPVVNHAPVEAPSNHEQALRGRVASLEQQLRESQAALRSAEARAQVVTPPPAPMPVEPPPPLDDTAPLPFPSNAHVAFTPKGFQDVVERALKECGLQMSQEAMDCSEFPCIAWMDSRQKHIDMSECAPWVESFGHKTSLVVRTVQGSDGGVRTLVGLMPLPEDASERRVALRRSRERSSSLLDSYPRP